MDYESFLKRNAKVVIVRLYDKQKCLKDMAFTQFTGILDSVLDEMTEAYEKCSILSVKVSILWKNNSSIKGTQIVPYNRFAHLCNVGSIFKKLCEEHYGNNVIFRYGDTHSTRQYLRDVRCYGNW